LSLLAKVRKAINIAIGISTIHIKQAELSEQLLGQDKLYYL
jgi:hypothetical protein